MSHGHSVSISFPTSNPRYSSGLPYGNNPNINPKMKNSTGVNNPGASATSTTTTTNSLGLKHHNLQEPVVMKPPKIDLANLTISRSHFARANVSPPIASPASTNSRSSFSSDNDNKRSSNPFAYVGGSRNHTKSMSSSEKSPLQTINNGNSHGTGYYTHGNTQTHATGNYTHVNVNANANYNYTPGHANHSKSSPNGSAGSNGKNSENRKSKLPWKRVSMSSLSRSNSNSSKNSRLSTMTISAPVLEYSSSLLVHDLNLDLDNRRASIKHLEGYRDDLRIKSISERSITESTADSTSRADHEESDNNSGKVDKVVDKVGIKAVNKADIKVVNTPVNTPDATPDSTLVLNSPDMTPKTTPQSTPKTTPNKLLDQKSFSSDSSPRRTTPEVLAKVHEDRLNEGPENMDYYKNRNLHHRYNKHSISSIDESRLSKAVPSRPSYPLASSSLQEPRNEQLSVSELENKLAETTKKLRQSEDKRRALLVEYQQKLDAERKRTLALQKTVDELNKKSSSDKETQQKLKHLETQKEALRKALATLRQRKEMEVQEYKKRLELQAMKTRNTKTLDNTDPKDPSQQFERTSYGIRPLLPVINSRLDHRRLGG